LFGGAVSISGDTIVVGAEGRDSETGSVYIFLHDKGGIDNWGGLKILTASDAKADDRFGHNLSLAGDALLVGTQNGSAYLFVRNKGGVNTWGELRKLTNPASSFGFAVCISMDAAII